MLHLKVYATRHQSTALNIIICVKQGNPELFVMCVPGFGLEGSLRGLHRVNPVSASTKLMRSSPRFCWEL